MVLIDVVNQYVDSVKFWEFVKQEGWEVELYVVCSNVLNFFCLFIVLFKLILLVVVCKVEKFFNIVLLIWIDMQILFVGGYGINVYEYLMMCVDLKLIEKLVEVNKELLVLVLEVLVLQCLVEFKLSEVKVESLVEVFCNIDDFMKVDLCIVCIVNVEYVEGVDKLVCLMLDVGNDEICNVFVGIKVVYDLVQLIGWLIVMVVNLVLCKMKFGLLEGMVFVVFDMVGKILGIFLLLLDLGVQFGM